jgi:hypothetical protein
MFKDRVMVEVEMPRLYEVVGIVGALIAAIAGLIRTFKNNHEIVVVVGFLRKEINDIKENLKKLEEKTESRIDDLSLKLARLEESNVYIKENIREALQWRRGN